MIKASYKKHVLKFNFPGGTSRGVLTEKPSWFITLQYTETQATGIGEISIIPKLSPENEQIVENELNKLISNTQAYLQSEIKYPAIKFGIETALKDLHTAEKDILYPSEFTEGKSGITINGLVWMGTKDEMYERIKDKIEQGFRCIKIKIGAINFNDEIELLKFIRSKFDKHTLELRVDANGAFSPNDAINKLNKLSEYHIHSIEQPIKQGQWAEMHKLCKNTPIPIALDEELIGIKSAKEKETLINAIKPQYIILKPSLVGGLTETKEWSVVAEKNNINWWVTSALEANIGLNAIAQWTFKYGKKIPQGLGTGNVFSNNTESPLTLRNQELWFNPNKM